MQPQIDKKKRTSTSGSRSKSKKSANTIRPDQTVELKSKPIHIFHNQDICAKIKTENSLSVNKSKASRKNSKSLKRPEKGTIKESKDQSYLVSAQRKYSANKITKTQATHIQSQDIYKKLYLIKKQLAKLQIPSNFSIAQMEAYFLQIKQSLANVSLQPLQSIFSKLHSMYITPIQKFLNMIRPYESILIKKQQISQLIQHQLEQNQKLYQQLDPQDIEIIKLKQLIQKNTQRIDQFKKVKQLQHNQFSMKKKKTPPNHTQTAKSPNHTQTAKSPNHTETAKFIDVSQSEHDFSSEKTPQQEFEQKLVKEYEKTPAFQEQKKPNFFRNDPQNQRINSFSGALKNRAEKDSAEKDFESIQPQAGQQKQKLEEDDQSQKQSSDNLDDEYLENEPDSLKQGSINPGQTSNKMGIKSGGMSFSFKLDIPKIDRSNVGFHDEFYSKLDEFSESWRNQALRQKRF